MGWFGVDLGEAKGWASRLLLGGFRVDFGWVWVGWLMASRKLGVGILLEVVFLLGTLVSKLLIFFATKLPSTGKWGGGCGHGKSGQYVRLKGDEISAHQKFMSRVR